LVKFVLEKNGSGLLENTLRVHGCERRYLNTKLAASSSSKLRSIGDLRFQICHCYLGCTQHLKEDESAQSQRRGRAQEEAARV